MDELQIRVGTKVGPGLGRVLQPGHLPNIGCQLDNILPLSLFCARLWALDGAVTHSTRAAKWGRSCDGRLFISGDGRILDSADLQPWHSSSNGQDNRSQPCHRGIHQAVEL